MSRMRWGCAIGVALLVVGGSGCGNELDDGYKPKPLNASSAQRRAFYATPFTPEANAQQERPDDFKSRRPGGY